MKFKRFRDKLDFLFWFSVIAMILLVIYLENYRKEILDPRFKKWINALVVWLAILVFSIVILVLYINLTYERWAEILVFLPLLIAFSAFFSASETAYLKISDAIKRNQSAYKEELAECGSFVRKGIKARSHKDNSDTTLASLLVLNCVVNLVGVTLIGVRIANDTGKDYLLIVITVIPVLFVGEISAKLFADKQPIQVARRTYYLFLLFYWPLGWACAELERPVNWIYSRLFASAQSKT